MGIGDKHVAVLALANASHLTNDISSRPNGSSFVCFTLADCAAAPSLFYADWVHSIADTYATLKAYRARLLARPSVVRCIDQARPYRAYFPLGTPDRD